MSAVDLQRAIDAFWAWWPTMRPRLDKAIASRDFGSVTDEIAARVSAIDPHLDWELGPGSKASHVFCVSAKGDSALRLVAERWFRSAPPPDATWEFAPARQGSPAGASMQLTIGPWEVDFAKYEVAFEVSPDEERIHVTLYNPVLASMHEGAAQTASFLLLDNTLGEDGVERWLGAIEVTTKRPMKARPYADLLAAVNALAHDATGEKFAVLRGERDGAPIFVTTNLALKRIDHLLCDHHVAIEIPLRNSTDDGLTTKEEADELNAAEDRLDERWHDQVAYLGRETTGGRRTLHFFAPDTPRTRAVVNEWVASLAPRYSARVTWSHDPRWEASRRWR